jgi:hypothetical protein
MKKYYDIIFTLLATVVWVVGIVTIVHILDYTVNDFGYWITLIVSLTLQFITISNGLDIIRGRK